MGIDGVSAGLGGGLEHVTSPEGSTTVVVLGFVPIGSESNVPVPAPIALSGLGVAGL